MNDEPRVSEAQLRAGPNLWLWSGLSFEIVENTLDLSDLDPIAASIQPEFAHLPVTRRVAGPMAGGLAPEGALLLVFTALAVPFLAEASKDAYRAFRGAVYLAYKKAKTWANGRGYAPLSVEMQFVTPEQRAAGSATGPNLYFIFRPGLEQSEFERAFSSFVALYDSIARTDPTWVVVLEWDAEAGSWVEKYRD